MTSNDLESYLLQLKAKFPTIIIEKYDSTYVILKEKAGPRILYIEPTLNCNLNCIMCFRRSVKEPFGSMKKELFEKIIDDAKKCGVKFIWFGGWGEPLTHPEIFEFIALARDANIDVGINTNGTLLTPEIAEKLLELEVETIVVSSDAATHETYARIRGTKYSRILEALKTIQKAKEKHGMTRPKVSFLFTAMANNVSELIDLPKIAREYGVSQIIVSNVIPVYPEMEKMVVYNGRLSDNEIRELASKLALETYQTGVRLILPNFKLRTERRCLFIENNTATITWDGKVVPCYNFIHTYKSYIFGLEKVVKQISFGDISKESLREIWLKPEYVKFRHKVKRFEFPSCPDCPLREYCSLRKTNEMDCWGNKPSCAECLYGREIVQCMV
ncbi:MAG: tungsten cofactor oxidoreductase radical SAM maturase [Candidatus Njordarchaeales archaeon]